MSTTFPTSHKVLGWVFVHAKTRNHRIADISYRTPNHYRGRDGRYKAISNWVKRTVIWVCSYLSASLPPDRLKRVMLFIYWLTIKRSEGHRRKMDLYDQNNTSRAYGRVPNHIKQECLTTKNYLFWSLTNICFIAESI